MQIVLETENTLESQNDNLADWHASVSLSVEKICPSQICLPQRGFLCSTPEPTGRPYFLPRHRLSVDDVDLEILHTISYDYGYSQL